MRNFGLGVLLSLLLGGLAFGQTAVYTNPIPTTTGGTNVSSTITTTSTFQKVFSAGGPPGPGGTTLPRRGCTIVNNGGHTMYVSEGQPIANATTSNTVPVAAGLAYYCASPGGTVLTGEIDITGTSGDAFYAAQY